MKPINWSFYFVVAAILGVIAGYVLTLVFRPGLLPPMLRLGGLVEPTTVLLLGTDVVYNNEPGHMKADAAAFSGRSDTILVARLDPIRNSITVLQIPRDTQVHISGYGTQKVNAANAIGGPLTARHVVSELLGIPIDHFVILNVQGLVKAVDEVGGVTVQVPKRMQYMDWTAKLKIDLEPGWHTLTGNQSMGFVRYRHDALGDIGRVQRQELFMRAAMDKALKPESWTHLPRLLQLSKEYVYTDMNEGDLMKLANFVRVVPKKNQQLVMLPGNFSGTGDWVSDESDIRQVVARLLGQDWQRPISADVRLAIENNSHYQGLGRRVARMMRAKGYNVVVIKDSPDREMMLRGQSNGAGLSDRTRIIAQRANPQEAELVKSDLKGNGEVVTASIGDILSSVTIVAGDDLEPIADSETATGR